MDEQETMEAILSLVGISLFFCLVTIGALLTSTNADSFLYLEFNPPEDYFLLIGLILINCIFLFYFLSHSLKFRKSKNLNYRTGEVLYISDKMRIYSCFNLPILGSLLYYFIKYNDIPISLYLLFIFLIGIGLIIIFFYNYLSY